jgi:ADP-ribose pyrophosphatase YjhB (NUDIX family)
MASEERVTRKRPDWMSETLWNQVKRHMPIPCIDIILQNPSGEILLGWRRILPYRNVWALPGGRLLRGEDLQTAARRILSEYSLSANHLYFVGVFPIRFPSRSDVSICVAGRHSVGQAEPDGREFSSFRWTRRLPSRLGANYRRMIQRWHLLTHNPQILEFNRL